MAKSKIYITVAITVYLLIFGCESARILAVFPVPSISHQVVFRPITQELSKRHEVLVITPDPAFPKGIAPANLTEIDVHDVSYNLKNEWFKVNAGNQNNMITQVEQVLQLFSKIFEEQLNDKSIRNLINDKTQKFDLIILEACVKPAIIYSHVFKAPVVLISSLGAVFDNNNVIGVTNHPILYPEALRIKLYNLTLLEKLKELYNYFRIKYAVSVQEKIDYIKLKKHFGTDIPTFVELNNNIDMLFLNLNQIWAGNVPVPPSVLYLGGLHQKPQKALPNDIEKFLDSSKRGVVYFSLGTNIKWSQLSRETVTDIIKVFASLPYDVLWKYDSDVLPLLADNIKTYKWLPQADILRHPNIKLFITQGGLQSIDEAITAGVPLLGIPMMLDQWFNVEQIVYHKIGLALNMETFNKNNFKEAIQTILGTNRYRENIIKLRSLMTDQPQKPLERAIWWIEHLLRHGGAKHLRSPVANMSLTEFIEIDVITAILAMIFIFLSVIVMLIYLLWRFIVTNIPLTLKLKIS